MSHETTAQPLILKRVLWPATDRAAWEALFTEGDIFDGAGPSCHWSHGSRYHCRCVAAFHVGDVGEAL